MNHDEMKEQLTKLLMESYDKGVADTMQAAMDALEKVTAIAAKAERDRCILILERLHEQVGDRHNYYSYAAKVLKGEI
jgi:hypothetical protein